MNEPGFWSAIATDDWEQALISGNGRQGALCYGGPSGVRLTLSHERLFLPVDAPLPAPQTARILPELRKALLSGRYQQAAEAVVAFAGTQSPGFRQLRRIDPLVGAATLWLEDLPGPGDGYRCGTDFATGVVSQAWAGARVEAFVSRAHDVVAIRVTAAGRPVRLRVRLCQIEDTPPVPVAVAVSTLPDGLLLTGDFPTAWPGAARGYAVACRVAVPGGVARPEPGGGLRIDGPGEVVLLLRTVVGGDPAPTLRYLRALPARFAELLDAHRRRHEPLMRRCRLSLGTPAGRPAAGADPRSSEELLARPEDPALVERLFDAGRYAIISSSGQLPPTLQGVWSGSYHPAWQSGYTLDGNLFAALAGLAPTGTPELLLPFFDLMDRHIGDFRENARRLYGAPGILLPPHLSTHGRHNHFDATWCLTFWTAGAAWAARVYEEYWTHTGDEEFWRCRGLPFLRAAAAFYAGFAPEGRFVPSYSPENTPAGTGSQAAVNATMDIAAVRALLRMLGERTDHLPAYRVAEDGTLAEWLWPGLSPNHAHRHASHLYPLWYAPDPAVRENPALRAAAGRTVRARLAWWRTAGAGTPVAAGEMAFGLVQLGLAAAALGMAETCHEIVTLLAGGYWRPNLVSTHNAGQLFNVDICGGFPALIAAMLLGSAPGWLEILPALPRAWPHGEIQGLLARGGVAVRRLAWSPERIELALRARTDTTIELRAPQRYGGTRELRLPADEVVDVRLVNRKN